MLNPTDAEVLLTRMDPDDSDPVRRLLKHSPDTAGGLMTSDPVVLTPDTSVAEALARLRDPDLTAALASMVFVARPPTATPTGHYLGCVHLQRLLREPPAELVGGIVDSDLLSLTPETPLAAVTRYFAAYNLVCGPVVDDQSHLLGAVTVDDLLDHLLPHDWRVDVPQLDPAGRPTPIRRRPYEQSPAPRRLYTPRTSRRFTPRLDPETIGQFTESIARFFGTGRYLLLQTMFVIIWIVAQPRGRALALGPLPIHPAQPGLLHPGRLRGPADPARPEPPGEP